MHLEKWLNMLNPMPVCGVKADGMIQGGRWPVCEGIKVGGGEGCHHRAGHGPRWTSQLYLHYLDIYTI